MSDFDQGLESKLTYIKHLAEGAKITLSRLEICERNKEVLQTELIKLRDAANELDTFITVLEMAKK